MIYFIQAGESGKIKIGYSKSPRKRLAQLQTGSSSQLQLLTIIEGNEDTEAKLHNKFREFKSNGEWFYPSSAILAFIQKSENEYELLEEANQVVIKQLLLFDKKGKNREENTKEHSPPEVGLERYFDICEWYNRSVKEIRVAAQSDLEIVRLKMKLEEGAVSRGTIQRFFRSHYCQALNTCGDVFTKKVSSISLEYKEWWKLGSQIRTENGQPKKLYNDMTDKELSRKVEELGRKIDKSIRKEMGKIFSEI